MPVRLDVSGAAAARRRGLKGDGGSGGLGSGDRAIYLVSVENDADVIHQPAKGARSNACCCAKEGYQASFAALL